MPKNKVDPLGRNHATTQPPANRWRVNAVCEYVMAHALKDFVANPSSDHPYFHAISLTAGNAQAMEVLYAAQENKNERE